MSRHNWTKDDENRLCTEVAEQWSIFEFYNQHRTKTQTSAWDAIAGRLWPDIKTTGGGARKRYSECRARYYEDMERDFHEDEEWREQLAKWDDVFEAYEVEDEPSGNTGQLTRIEDKIDALCAAWDVAPALGVKFFTGYDDPRIDVPLCVSCGHWATSHAVDDEELRQCCELDCDCKQFKVKP